MSLDATRASNILNAIHNVASFVAPTGPIKVRLMRINGSSTANGTEVSTGTGTGTGAGYTAGGVTITYNTAVDGYADLTTSVTWTNLPAVTLTGVEVWDSAGTPRRWEWGVFSDGPRVLDSGDPFTLDAELFVSSLQ
jgi:hypothetical protein